MSEKTFFVWIAMINDHHTEHFVGRLVRRNWKVCSLGETLTLHNEDNLTTIAAISIVIPFKDEKDDNEKFHKKVLEDIKDVLKQLNVYYYSVIMSYPGGHSWCLGNVTKNEIQKLESEKIEKRRTVN